jgi:hypothetical protein
MLFTLRTAVDVLGALTRNARPTGFIVARRSVLDESSWTTTMPSELAALFTGRFPATHQLLRYYAEASDGVLHTMRSTAWTGPCSSSQMALYTSCCRWTGRFPSNMDDTTSIDTCDPFGSSYAPVKPMEAQKIQQARGLLVETIRGASPKAHSKDSNQHIPSVACARTRDADATQRSATHLSP